MGEDSWTTHGPVAQFFGRYLRSSSNAEGLAPAQGRGEVRSQRGGRSDSLIGTGGAPPSSRTVRLPSPSCLPGRSGGEVGGSSGHSAVCTVFVHGTLVGRPCTVSDLTLGTSRLRFGVEGEGTTPRDPRRSRVGVSDSWGIGGCGARHPSVGKCRSSLCQGPQR